MVGTLSKDDALDAQSPGKAFGSACPVTNACLVVGGALRQSDSSARPPCTPTIIYRVQVKFAEVRSRRGKR
jgi:hypothetical protein